MPIPEDGYGHATHRSFSPQNPGFSWVSTYPAGAEGGVAFGRTPDCRRGLVAVLRPTNPLRKGVLPKCYDVENNFEKGRAFFGGWG